MATVFPQISVWLLAFCRFCGFWSQFLSPPQLFVPPLFGGSEITFGPRGHKLRESDYVFLKKSTMFFPRRIERCRCLDRSWCSKTIENGRKIIAFAICSPTKIDASRFSGPEQFFAGAPYISVQKSNVVFSTPNRPMLAPRSIAVLEDDRKLHYVAICLLRTRRQILTARAHALSARDSSPLPLSSLFFAFPFFFLPRSLRSARTRLNARQLRAKILSLMNIIIRRASQPSQPSPAPFASF